MIGTLWFDPAAVNKTFLLFISEDTSVAVPFTTEWSYVGIL